MNVHLSLQVGKDGVAFVNVPVVSMLLLAYMRIFCKIRPSGWEILRTTKLSLLVLVPTFWD